MLPLPGHSGRVGSVALRVNRGKVSSMALRVNRGKVSSMALEAIGEKWVRWHCG